MAQAVKKPGFAMCRPGFFFLPLNAMRLTGTQSFFELKLLDFQDSRLPIGKSGPQVLELAVRSGWQRHRSVALGAVLRTDEIDQLIGWLRQMSEPHTRLPRLLFHDPSLAFDCLTADADECLLQIKLDQDLTPAWHVDPFAPFWIPVLTTRRAVEQAAEDLYAQFTTITGVV